MGRPVIVIGPSGSGKSTVAQYIINNFNAVKIISTTSRNPRVGEVDGIHYNFKDKQTIEQMIDDNEFLEYSIYAGNYYGITKTEIEKKVNLADFVVNVMEIVGALKIKEMYPETIIIYCETPVDILMQRMNDRGDEFKSISKRIKTYVDEKEWENIKYADFVLNNSGELSESCKILDDFINKNLIFKS